MITNFFLNIAYKIATWFISLFPQMSLIDPIISAFSQAATYLHSIYVIFPLSTTAILSVVSIYISIEIGIFSFKIINWVWGKIPIIGKK